MAFTFNGIGTTFYGARDFALDGSYTTTEWFVLVYIPIIPLRSLRIRNAQGGKNLVFYTSEQYAVFSKGRPNPKQVLSIYGWCAALVACAGLEKVPVVGQVPLLPITCMIAVAFLPWILRRLARKRVLAPFQAIYSSFQSAPESDEFKVLLQARREGWDSERTQQEMAKVTAQKKPK
jgi:hypothetical protein